VGGCDRRGLDVPDVVMVLISVAYFALFFATVRWFDRI